MIDYEFGYWGIALVCHSNGNIFKKSFTMSIPPTLLALLLGYSLETYFRNQDQDSDMVKAWDGRIERLKNLSTLWSTFCFALTFLLVFRTQIAYSRYWAGITLLQNIKGGWLNATSNLFSFCSGKEDKQQEVESFQHFLVRLMSMLYCTALQEVAVMADEHFFIIGEEDNGDVEGFANEHMRHYRDSEDRLEMVMQWVQRLIVQSNDKKVIDIAPPILSRVFQELSNGIVSVNDAAKLAVYPFPFPYVQMLTLMLLIFSLATPLICVLVVDSPIFAAAVAFFVNGALWSMNYIAAEIEMPFGDDVNDLPVGALQVEFNRKLKVLLHPLTQNPPLYTFSERHRDIVGHGHACRSSAAAKMELYKAASKSTLGAAQHHKDGPVRRSRYSIAVPQSDQGWAAAPVSAPAGIQSEQEKHVLPNLPPEKDVSIDATLPDERKELLPTFEDKSSTKKEDSVANHARKPKKKMTAAKGPGPEAVGAVTTDADVHENDPDPASWNSAELE